MYISKQTDYAVLLMASLAQESGNDEPLSLMEFSLQEDLSFYFLQRIARKLKKAGLIRGIEGRNGGYCLTRPPLAISVGEVIRAMEGGIRVADCATEEPDKVCPRQDRCTIQKTWNQLKKQIAAFYDQLSLSDVVKGGPAPITS